MLLIYFFSYIYTFIQIKPEELAKNLNEAGGFVPGVRPGKDTENHISKILVRLTFVGGFFIAILAAIPIVFSMIGGLESAAAIGGRTNLNRFGQNYFGNETMIEEALMMPKRYHSEDSSDSDEEEE